MLILFVSFFTRRTRRRRGHLHEERHLLTLGHGRIGGGRTAATGSASRRPTRTRRGRHSLHILHHGSGNYNNNSYVNDDATITTRTQTHLFTHTLPLFLMSSRHSRTLLQTNTVGFWASEMVAFGGAFCGGTGANVFDVATYLAPGNEFVTSRT